jgi:hypothetical protein
MTPIPNNGPRVDVITDMFLQHGILGALIVVLFGIVVFLYKSEKSERDARLTDFKELWSTDIKYREEVKNLLQSLKDLILGGKKQV